MIDNLRTDRGPLDHSATRRSSPKILRAATALILGAAVETAIIVGHSSVERVGRRHCGVHPPDQSRPRGAGGAAAESANSPGVLLQIDTCPYGNT